MDWEMVDFSYVFQWYIVVPNVLARIVLPVITCFFFCWYVRVSFTWSLGVVYTGLSMGLWGLEMRLGISGGVGLVMEILLLVFCGVCLLKRTWMEALTMAVLIMSVLSVTSSMIRWLDYREIAPLVIEHETLLIPSDGIRELLRVLLVIALFVLILKEFREGIVSESRMTLMQFTIPAFLIALIERVIQDSIYGNGLVVDYYTKEILPNINIHYGEIFFLQIFACICLFAALLVNQRIGKILRAQQKLQLLEQQAAQQENYIREAKIRYQKTSSFRHDIKNHLIVLAKLLKDGQTEEAFGYLENLEGISSELSYPVWTGNGAVDALLGSKCFIAEQKGIEIRCEIRLPEDGGVKDVDWCILLSNAVDNAIAGCEEVDGDGRYIHISDKRKGNFYVLSIENSCRRDLQEPIKEGTGLFNMRATAKKYEGTVDISVSQGVFKWKALFIMQDSIQGEKVSPRRPFTP